MFDFVPDQRFAALTSQLPKNRKLKMAKKYGQPKDLKIGMPLPETYADRVQAIIVGSSTAKIVFATDMPDPRPDHDTVELRANQIIVLPVPELLKFYGQLREMFEKKGQAN